MSLEQHKIFLPSSWCNDEMDVSDDFCGTKLVNQMFAIDLINQESWEELRKLLKSGEFIQEIQIEPIENPMTLFHVACTASCVPVDIIVALFNIFPRACLMEDEDGSLPIHLACSTHGMSLKVIKVLMTLCPESCFHKERIDGELPIYMLLNKNIAVNQLIASLPQECILRSNTSILHEVCYHILPDPLIRVIIETYPDVCKVRHRNGDTLAHIICSHRRSTANTVAMILQKFPGICATPDNYGNLPLHVVNSDIEAEKIIQILLRSYPDGLFFQNAHLQTPLSSPYVRDSPNKVRALLEYSSQDTRYLLRARNQHGLIPMAEFFYDLQLRLSSKVFYIQGSLSSLVEKNTDIEIKSLFYIMSYFFYDSIELWEEQQRWTSTVHNPKFWTSFPLFSKMLLNNLKSVTNQEDRNGDLPLHCLSRECLGKNTLNKCASCSHPIQGPYIWMSEYEHNCTNCKGRVTMQSNSTTSRPSLLDYQRKFHIAIFITFNFVSLYKLIIHFIDSL